VVKAGGVFGVEAGVFGVEGSTLTTPSIDRTLISGIIITSVTFAPLFCHCRWAVPPVCLCAAATYFRMYLSFLSKTLCMPCLACRLPLRKAQTNKSFAGPTELRELS
jgi:hypothetical protein